MKQAILFIILLSRCIHFSLGSSKYEISIIMNILHTTLDYIMENTNEVVLSSYFGIIRGKALLNEIKQERLSSEDASKLIAVKEKFDAIIMLRNKVLRGYEEWVLEISNTFLWQKRISYKYLNDVCFTPTKNETIKIINLLSNEAEMAFITPEMFTFCMEDLYNASKISNCQIQESCKNFMLNMYNGIGYETTHRLLYIQAFQVWKCHIQNFKKMYIQPLCSYIYIQTLVTQGRGPFFDLFLEQIFLCGSEGYLEFLDINWFNVILNNQLSEGCFPVFQKRTNFSIYTNECSSHATGLAIASLALYSNFLSSTSGNEHK